MIIAQQTQRRMRLELDELRVRLREAEETLEAIRTGEVDALVVNGPNGDQIFSLRGAEAPYRVFVEQMQEGAVTLTPDGTVLFANRRFAELVGLPLERVISSPLQLFVEELFAEQVAESLRSPAGRSVAVRLVRHGQPPLPVQFSFNTMDVDGADAVCLVVTDLRIQHEKEQLANALAELRATEERLRRQNEELSAARAALEAASSAKDNFIAALSHELRTPLTPVLMSVAALSATAELPAELRHELNMVRRNVELEARLIDDLLDLTRIAQNKLTLDKQPVEVHQLLRTALDITRSELAGKHVEVNTKLEAKRPHVLGDPVRLQQVFWNLIRNALKFTPRRGRVDISTWNERKGRRTHLLVEVRDTGIGIDAEALERIFNAFEQGDSRITRQFGGLGLGLAISRRLAQLQGGDISVTSAGRGHGSTFTLTLPTVAPPRRLKARRTPKPAGARRQLRILLVEDHEDTRRNMVRLLAALDHTVDSAATAAEALRKAQQQPYDLVISDLGLPDKSGFELMRRLRDRHKLKGICLSGYGMEDDIARGRASGFQEHLTKPIGIAQLEQAIARVGGE